MIKLWICLALIAVTGLKATSLNDGEDDGWYDDYWNYEDEETFNDFSKEPLKSTTAKESDVTNISKILSDSTENSHLDDKNNFDNLHDYQYEDNRFEAEQQNDDATNIPLSSDKSSESDRISTQSSDSVDINKTVSTSITDNADVINPVETPTHITKSYDDLEYSSSDSVRKIIEETKSILNEDTDNDFTEYKPDKEDNENVEGTSVETAKILDDTPDSFDEDDDNNTGEEIDNKSIDFISKGIQETTEEDTVDKALFDLMADIDKLHETWSKLSDYDYNGPKTEIGKDAWNDKEKTSVEGDYYEEIDDDNLEKLFAKNDESGEENIKSQENTEENILRNSNEKSSGEIPIRYFDDALFASDSGNSTEQIDQLESTATTSVQDINDSSTGASIVTTEAQGKDVSQQRNLEKLSSVEVDELVGEFTEQHQKELNITSADVREYFYVRLTVDKPVVVTSPNYPELYPTNATVDWLFVGDGMGIELNITDFAVNGFAGDYVLVKPGGVDASGSTGLLFTYTLRSERRYRFLDVDRMFVRFQANQAQQFLRGFSFSVRSVVPRQRISMPEPEPEPPVTPIPPATITVNLGGISVADFLKIEEQFRLIIADMATLYMNTHGISPGLNTTIETTQIISRALCFHNWPKFEQCTEVRFGVPIVYEETDIDEEEEARLSEKDLWEMWETLWQRDPFAVRLRMLGITEYQVPNDRGVLTVWLVIAGGVVISMAMLAFALWRFSCFDNYTRMPSFSDADSVNEKRKLDLYPTPHQTLPPLYSETDYKWADAKYDDTKVDVSGYSNSSYLNSDPFDIDSDEDALSSRNRYASFSPRDIYNA